MDIDVLSNIEKPIRSSQEFKNKTCLSTDIYERANSDRLEFWNQQAAQLDWFEPWKETLKWKRPDAKWFVDGKLNAAYNCLDVHVQNEIGHKH